MELAGFFISTTPVTQALWERVTGANPAVRPDPQGPVENVSWEHLTGQSGFLDRLNASEVLSSVAAGDAAMRFRLPSAVGASLPSPRTPISRKPQ
jgi:formylglycine-generating enzyme required for sulfatase activity